MGLVILPTDFGNKSVEIGIGEATKVLRGMGLEIPNSIRSASSLDNYLKEALDFTVEMIDEFMEGIKNSSNK